MRVGGQEAMLVSRRGLLIGAGALGMLPLLDACGGGGAGGNRLVVGIVTEPTSLTSAITSAGGPQLVSTKIFDGLLGYAADMTPRPRLATEWITAPDNLSLTLKLRPGVKWHDGKPFTSADVAFSLLEVWKKYHSRGRSTFANVVAVDTPDPLTAVLRLSQPAPYIISALGANESQVIPKHLYEGKDVLSNPANNAPVGTGPFRFVEWQRGQFVTLERNPDYWDAGKPHIDGVVFRLFGDANSLATALETGEIQFTDMIAAGDVARVAKLPGIRLDNRPFALSAATLGLEFNLDLPKFKDVRLRRAIAHAIDGDFVLKHVFYDNAEIATGPIPASFKNFYSPDVPRYPFDVAKAKALLDEAGLKAGPDGTRLRFTLDPAPIGERSTRLADYIRSALADVGIKADIRAQDFATFVKRAYTDRDFEVILAGGQMGPDPAIGMQRFFWSKSFQKGVAFSNASHYASPEADRLLEAGQVETDPAKRKQIYADFQRVVQTDLPRITLVTNSQPLLGTTRLSPIGDTAEGPYGNFAALELKPA